MRTSLGGSGRVHPARQCVTSPTSAPDRQSTGMRGCGDRRLARIPTSFCLSISRIDMKVQRGGPSIRTVLHVGLRRTRAVPLSKPRQCLVMGPTAKTWPRSVPRLRAKAPRSVAFGRQWREVPSICSWLAKPLSDDALSWQRQGDYDMVPKYSFVGEGHGTYEKEPPRALPSTRRGRSSASLAVGLLLSSRL